MAPLMAPARSAAAVAALPSTPPRLLAVLPQQLQLALDEVLVCRRRRGGRRRQWGAERLQRVADWPALRCACSRPQRLPPRPPVARHSSREWALLNSRSASCLPAMAPGWPPPLRRGLRSRASLCSTSRVLSSAACRGGRGGRGRQVGGDVLTAAEGSRHLPSPGAAAALGPAALPRPSSCPAPGVAAQRPGGGGGRRAPPPAPHAPLHPLPAAAPQRNRLSPGWRPAGWRAKRARGVGRNGRRGGGPALAHGVRRAGIGCGRHLRPCHRTPLVGGLTWLTRPETRQSTTRPPTTCAASWFKSRNMQPLTPRQPLTAQQGVGGRAAGTAALAWEQPILAQALPGGRPSGGTGRATPPRTRDQDAQQQAQRGSRALQVHNRGQGQELAHHSLPRRETRGRAPAWGSEVDGRRRRRQPARATATRRSLPRSPATHLGRAQDLGELQARAWLGATEGSGRARQTPRPGQHHRQRRAAGRC